ncbi:MAG: NUDIX domain-containing protein [Candidatus Dojkabacteria bacterium]|nr:NUDIX domain-containing protein [Candidatus Dojkabacteria bacterium]MDQ7021468.1 NUDIX domain-containing protein [Candidatus Dojkabacteria bacterium]
MSLNHIQNQILSKLTVSEEGLSYTMLIPENTAKDLFNYHLKFLLEKKYILKSNDKNYFLTDVGKSYVQRMDVKGDYKKYFKFSVLPYVTKEENGKRFLMRHKRIRHPYFGEITSVSGKVKWGEKIAEAASRKIEEESGLICTNFLHIGVLRSIRRFPKDKVFQDTLYHVCIGENPEGNLKEKTEFGENSWMSFDEAIKNAKNNVTNSKYSIEIIKRIRDRSFEMFYFEEDIELEHL